MPGTASQELIDRVETFFAGYVAAFSALSVTDIAAYWAVPATFSKNGKTIIIETEPALRESLERLCDFYRSQGLARVAGKVLGVYAQSPTATLVRLFYEPFDDQGRSLTSWEHLYSLRAMPDGLKAVLTIADGEAAAWAARAGRRM